MSHPLESHVLSATTLGPLENFQPAFQRAVRAAGAVLGGAAAVASVVSLPAAQAQQASGTTLAPVTVTGQHEGYQTPAASGNPRVTAPLLETPKSITVISEELIQDRGATSLQDVLRTTPGITLGSGEGGTPNGDRPFIRGYEASTDMFVDGVRDFARGSHETFNLESVEVISGPSSAYTGRGGTGGSINLQSKSARLGRFVEGRAGYGSDSQYRATADANVAFSETGAVRMNLMKAGGEVAGRDGVDIKRQGIATAVAFGLSTPTRVKLSYSHIENKDMPDQGIPLQNAAHPELNRPPMVPRDNFYGRLHTDWRENTMKTGTAIVEHDFNEAVAVRNTLRKAKSLNQYLLARPTFDNCKAGDTSDACNPLHPDAQFTRGSRARWRSSESVINQTDVFGQFTTGTIKHRYIAGLELGKEEIFNKDVTGTPASEVDSLWHPNPRRDYSYALTLGDKKAAGEIKTRSLYFFDTLDLAEQWSLNAGARRESFEVDNTTLRRKDNFWNWQLGLVYKPVEHGSVYVSWGTSSNPAGENLGQGGGADGVGGAAQVRDIKPEKSRSWELGTKWDVMENHALSLTAAVFETKKTDARSTDTVTGDVTLDGNNRVRGLEFGASGAVTARWNVWAGLSFLDPKILHYRSGNNSFDGNRIKFIAKRSATLWTTYKVLSELTVGGGANYMGLRFANDANTLELPSHVRWDAMARYDINQQMSMQLNVNNISNRALYDASHVGLFANVGPGRSYMLTATWRFE